MNAKMFDVVDRLDCLARGPGLRYELEVDHPAGATHGGTMTMPGEVFRERKQPRDHARSIGFCEPTGGGRADLFADPVAEAEASLIDRFGADGEFGLHLAVTGEQRLTCWNLVYEEYVSKGYAKPQPLPLRYTLHDALPGTGTFLVESAGRAAGTVSVFPDSPLGLPADDIFKDEIDGLRRQGRRPMEVGRLTICREHMNQRCIQTSMFNILSLFSRCFQNATDLIVTVNPSHVKFYERMLLFKRIGEEKCLGSVCDAPAVLMSLDLELQKRVTRWENNEGPKPEGTVERTFYRYFSSRKDEQKKVARMRECLSEPGEAFLKRYFVGLSPLLPESSMSLQRFFQQCYPEYQLKEVF